MSLIGVDPDRLDLRGAERLQQFGHVPAAHVRIEGGLVAPFPGDMQEVRVTDVDRGGIAGASRLPAGGGDGAFQQWPQALGLACREAHVSLDDDHPLSPSLWRSGSPVLADPPESRSSRIVSIASIR